MNSCSCIRLKTYVTLLAGPGPGFRAVDALFVRIKDLELKPARVFVIGEYTKIKTNRYVFLTEEIVSQSNQWLEYKYRTRRVS